MDIDVTSVDHALMTTRAVRRRLDLEKPVDHQILLDCIDVAEQAPSGGNQGSRRWVIVTEQRVKDQLAELYMQAAGQWMIDTHERISGTGHPQERVMASAAYLAEHLAEVPAIVIPTIIGVHDGSGRPGLFDSVIQSVWSFSVALRARGLGSAWTTANLSRQDDIAELLGIPAGMTQIAMIPVAWSKGTDFKLAPRLPARDITYFNKFGRTFQSGPSESPVHADGAGAVAEADIKATPEQVWRYVTDINLSKDQSDEFMGARWADGFTEPALGAQFIGTNKNDFMGEWDITCHIDRFEEHGVFGWSTVDPNEPSAQWWFDLTAIAGATRLRFNVIIGPGASGLTSAIAQMPDKEARILANRADGLRANMNKVVQAVKERAEADAAEARTARKASAPPPLS